MPETTPSGLTVRYGTSEIRKPILITVAQGSQGPRTYRFSAQRVRATRRRKPGEELWAVWRRNLDGSEPRYYLYVGGSRWRIEHPQRSSRLRRVTWGWTNTRPAAGQGGIAMCLLGGAFLLSLQQDWGEKDAPDHEATGVPGGAGDAAPGAVATNGLAVPTRDAAPPAAKAGWSRHLKPVVDASNSGVGNGFYITN